MPLSLDTIPLTLLRDSVTGMFGYRSALRDHWP